MTALHPANAITYKREAKGQATLDSDLKPVLVALATDQPLDAKYRDHDLSGDWAGYRECHIKPDLLLIYQKAPLHHPLNRYAVTGGALRRFLVACQFVAGERVWIAAVAFPLCGGQEADRHGVKALRSRRWLG